MILPFAHYRWTISFEKLIKKEYHNFPESRIEKFPQFTWIEQKKKL